VDSWEQLRQKAASSDPGYTLFVLNDLEASGGPVVIDGKALTITGRGTQTINRAPDFTGSFFEVKNGGSLTIGDGKGALVLDGNKAVFSFPYPASLITVSDGNLILNNSIVRNNISSHNGGGVYFDCPGTGSFIMNNSVITGNGTNSSISSVGGGVYFNCMATGNGSFIMNNSAISGNVIKDGFTAGGGVSFRCFGAGNFVMTNSRIEGNRYESMSSSLGGGVSFTSYGQGSFTMTNSVIRNNTGFTTGGGVYITAGGGNGSVIMNMNGGEISGNTARDYGGGVYIGSSATFTKEPGGIIYGKDGDEDSNLVKDSSGDPLDGQGHAVYIEADPDPLVRDTTAGADITFNGTTWSAP
jgi:hypothetical protein